jgi:trk system potassium uptake protein TrkA
MRVLIVGAGQVGFAIAERLTVEGHDVVLVDRDLERLAEITQRVDLATVQGTGCSPVVLRQAGIDKAGMVIAVTDSDEVNLLACLVAGKLAPSAMRLARVRDPEYHEDPRLFQGEPFGLAAVINPEEEAARRIARTLQVPGAMDVIPFVNGTVALLGVRIDPGSPLDGKSMEDIRPMSDVAMRVACIEHRGTVIIPRGPDRLLGGDIAYVSCLRRDAEKVLRFAGKRSDPVKRVMIYGAEDLATYLAGMLDQDRVAVKIISTSTERCRLCAERVPRALVVQGDGTDPEVLREEGIEDIDAFIACSRQQDRNVPAALLAKSLGARLAMVAAANATYEHLALSIGIDAATSPQSAVVGSILQFVRQGRVFAVQSLWSRDVEVIELQALESSRIVSRPLKDAGFPKGAMVLAASRGSQTVVPTGDTVIEPGDHVVCIVQRGALQRIEKIFAGRSDSLPPPAPSA